MSKSKLNETKPAVAPEATPVKRTVVTDLSVLEAMSAIKVEVLLQGEVFVFAGRRLRPREVKEVQLLLQEALPPVVPDPDSKSEKPEPRYDFTDPAYQRRMADNKRKARATALWAAFPTFRQRAGEEKPPQTPEEITTFVEGLDLDDDVLETLFQALTRSVVTTAYLGFTSGSSFPGN